MPIPRQWPFLLLLSLLDPAAGQQPQPPQQAQQPARLGVFFWHDSPNDLAALAGIRDGLRATRLPHEFLERRADSDPARAEQALGELRASGCQLVFAMGTQAALLAADALPDLPVVFAAVTNPVAAGLVKDWSGSKTRLAGASNWIPPQTVLDVFLRAVPDLQRLGMLRSASSGVVSAAELATMRSHLGAVAAPRVALFEAVAADAADIPRAVDELLQRGATAIWIPVDFTIYQSMPVVLQALAGRRVPLLTTSIHAARSGAIAGVTVDFALHGQRAAALALRVLRGADPGALPVDTMQSYLVIANVTAAERAGHELPLSLLVLADELIVEEGADAGR